MFDEGGKLYEINMQVLLYDAKNEISHIHGRSYINVFICPFHTYECTQHKRIKPTDL